MSVGFDPPQMEEWLLARVLDARSRDFILGDLHEEYGRRVRQHGRSVAVAWYRRQAVGAVLPSVHRRLAVHFASRDSNRERRVKRRSVGAMLDGMRSDARIAGRGLLRRPGYALLGVATLAIAIGANAAMFGVMDAALLKALPYPEADRIVLVSELHEEMQDLGWSSVPNLLDWKAESRSFEAMGLFRGRSMALTGDADPAYAYGSFVTPDFFAVFGTDAGLGRVMEGADAVEGAPAVVVIGHGLWQRRYGGDRSVLGRELIVDGVVRTIVGVMPASFTAPNEWIGARFPLDMWIPFVVDPETQGRGDRSYNVVGRLREGVDLESAAAEMSLIGARLARAYPEANEDWVLRMDVWRDAVVGDVRETLVLMMGAMLLVLVVACANVGNLVLNRALGRRAEFAIRTALGAGRSGVGRVAVLESLLLATVAGAAGLFLARIMVGVLVALDPGNVPGLANATVDLRVLAATLTMSVLVGLFAGVIPAMHGFRSDAVSVLGSAGRAAGANRRWRGIRDGFAVAQLALALVLFVGSALVARAFVQLRAVQPGFDTDGVLVATVALSWDRVSTIEQRSAFVRTVLERLRAVPGVESAAMINSLPFSGSHQQQTFAIAGEPVQPDHEPFAALRGVSPEYIATMRIPLRGREFRAADLIGSPAVAMVNDAFVARYLPGREATGSRILLQGGDLDVEVVGVVGDVRHYGLAQPARPEIYLPYTADYLTSKSFVVRASGDPYALAQSVGHAIHNVDPDQPLRGVEAGLGVASTISMNDQIGASLATPRFLTVILVLLTSIAVLLSLIGLFAVVSQSVAERSREIGVRVALGAGRRRVLSWILSWSGRLALAGIAIGLVLTLAAGRLLESLLFGASARDPITITGALVVFLAIASCAAVLPALRATRVDPACVLREP